MHRCRLMPHAVWLCANPGESGGTQAQQVEHGDKFPPARGKPRSGKAGTVPWWVRKRLRLRSGKKQEKEPLASGSARTRRTEPASRPAKTLHKDVLVRARASMTGNTIDLGLHTIKTTFS